MTQLPLIILIPMLSGCLAIACMKTSDGSCSLGGLRQLFQLGHIGPVDAMDDTVLCPLHAQKCLNASGQVEGDMILLQKANEVSTVDVMVLTFPAEQCHSCCNFREKRGKEDDCKQDGANNQEALIRVLKNNFHAGRCELRQCPVKTRNRPGSA